MAQALYDPERGYYSRQIKTVGKRGDFSTSATLSPDFAAAVANWLKSESSLQTNVRHVIEIGAGSGVLMESVKRSLGWWKRRQFHWHVVETSEVLQKQQKLLLGDSVTWHKNLKAALETCEGKAFLYHNELLDAFPVMLLQWQEGLWQEVHITPAGREISLPLEWDETMRAPFTALQAWPGKAARQRIEIHAAVRNWMLEWAPAWKQGAMLTVDYGDVFPALYYRRPVGTLRGYLHQQRLEGEAVYMNPGRQDITADINFSDYRNWAAELNWKEISYGNQSVFIQTYLKKLSPHPATAFIMDLHGAGEAFKYLIHRPG
ncbi:SAM-dependent MidA family methyltransferase [Prosthecobacter fusiformis]|uniref:SAM-dependent MidA family methyltransferase n=2 Tax=Prosthecobacter fusiformis TaxID=48464 RepID=A0A4R7RLD8_9BACT|nr:SAM-dependent methyltransferase [Prosthecobacter fusiformis]TDU64576.1 SAM-dependent MidA family methyltransferase [Prosthecobacter fusiformis]